MWREERDESGSVAAGPLRGALVRPKRLASSRSSFSVTACSITATKSPSGPREPIRARRRSSLWWNSALAVNCTLYRPGDRGWMTEGGTGGASSCRAPVSGAATPSGPSSRIGPSPRFDTTGLAHELGQAVEQLVVRDRLKRSFLSHDWNIGPRSSTPCESARAKPRGGVSFEESPVGGDALRASAALRHASSRLPITPFEGPSESCQGESWAAGEILEGVKRFGRSLDTTRSSETKPR